MKSKQFLKSQYSDPYIWTRKNALSKDFCDKVIEKFDKDERTCQGLIDLGTLNLDIKRSVDLTITNLDEWKEEDIVFYKSLTENIKLYREYLSKNIFNCKIFPFGLETDIIDWGYQIQKTDLGEFYKWHDDFLTTHDGYCRSITYIWYLNDVDNGGETQFYDGTMIKPKTGTILIFPATWTYLHQGCEVKSGIKYICTGWIGHK